jgi:Xaa-Pro aminopeptidase
MENFKKFKKQRILNCMAEADLSLLIGSLPQNIFYCVEYQSVAQVLLSKVDMFSVFNPRDDIFSIVAGCSEVPTIIEQVPGASIYAYGKFFFHFSGEDKFNSRVKKTIAQSSADSAEALKKAISETGIENGRVGLDESKIRPALWQDVIDSFPNLEFIPAADLFYRIRMIKHAEEIRRLERAAEIAEKSLYHVISKIKPGMTEKEMGIIYTTQIILQGGTPYFNVMTADYRSAYVDTINMNNSIKRGSMIRFDVGGDFEGYKADMSRTAVLGTPPAKVVDFYAAIRAGLEKGKEAAGPGITAAELFHITVKETQRGLPRFKRHHVGHGIGLEIYDPPSIAPENDIRLETGMVLCLETPYYEPGWGGVQVEDTILITGDGSRGLTKTSRDLVVIDV